MATWITLNITAALVLFRVIQPQRVYIFKYFPSGGGPLSCAQLENCECQKETKCNFVFAVNTNEPIRHDFGAYS